ncbi:MAG TPA: MFS transporter [Thermomicrobiales bacterium]|nr:MFS transporter [Thermomicrobiales bacterium]
MTEQDRQQTVFGIYRGWIVVIAVMITLAIASGGRFLFGIVLKPVSEEFGWGRAELALAVTISVIALSVLQPLVGWLVDRFGSRRILIAGVVTTAAAMIPMTRATSLWQIYVFYGLLAAFGFAATSPVNTTALVNGWFEKRRGLALSMATSGAAYGQLLIVPIATAVMLGWGWRATYLAISAALFLLVLPLVMFFVRDSPSRQAAMATRGTAAYSAERVRLKHAIRTLPYWQLSFGMFVCGFTMGFTSVHMIPYLTDMPEHSHHTMQTTASFALAVVGGCSILGAIVIGFVSDRKGHREMLAMTYFLRGLAFLVLIAVGSYIPGIFVAAVILGISWTSTTPLASAISADIFGRASLGTIFGFIFTAMNVGSGAGAWLAGLDRDVLGNYHASLIANVIMGFAAAAVTLSIRKQPFQHRVPRAAASAAAAPGVRAGRTIAD